MARTTTDTGHEIGGVYRSSYWGYTYRVIGEGYMDGSGVRVQCIDGGPSQTASPGEVWSHSTRLDKRDRVISASLSEGR